MRPLEIRVLKVIKTFGPMTAWQLANVLGTSKDSCGEAARLLCGRSELFVIGKLTVKSYSRSPNVQYGLEPPKTVAPKPVEKPKAPAVSFGGEIALAAMQSVCRARLMANQLEAA